MRYEDLRRTVTSEIWSTSGSWGLTLLLRRGLSAWMHAWPQEVDTAPPIPQPALPSVSRPAVSTSFGPQLVTVLANMILTARQEVLV
jgi:hypothetical protein